MRKLLLRGYTVRVLLTPEGAASVLRFDLPDTERVEVVVASLDNHQALMKAVNGVAKVFACVPAVLSDCHTTRRCISVIWCELARHSALTGPTLCHTERLESARRCVGRSVVPERSNIQGGGTNMGNDQCPLGEGTNRDTLD